MRGVHVVTLDEAGAGRNGIRGNRVKSNQGGNGVFRLDGLEGELQLPDHEIMFVATTNCPPRTVFTDGIKVFVVDFHKGASTDDRQALKQKISDVCNAEGPSLRDELRLEATLTLLAGAAELERGARPSLALFRTTEDFETRTEAARADSAKKFMLETYVKITDDNMTFPGKASVPDYIRIEDVCGAVNAALSGRFPPFVYTSVKLDGDFIRFLKAAGYEPIADKMAYPVAENGRLDTAQRRKLSGVLRLFQKVPASSCAHLAAHVCSEPTTDDMCVDGCFCPG